MELAIVAYNGVRLARDDEAGREALAQYIIRNPFAVSKITYNPASGMVIYKSKPTPSRSKGGRRNFQVFSATEFIAAITQHIPEKSFQLVRYYGWYSNRGRGKRAKGKADTASASQSAPPAAVEVLDLSDYWPRKIPSPFLVGVHQEGLGDRPACLSQVRRGDEDYQLYHRGGDHPPDSGAFGIMEGQNTGPTTIRPRPAGAWP